MASAALARIRNINATIQHLICRIQKNVTQLETFLQTAAEEEQFVAEKRNQSKLSGVPQIIATLPATDANSTDTVRPRCQ